MAADSGALTDVPDVSKPKSSNIRELLPGLIGAFVGIGTVLWSSLGDKIIAASPWGGWIYWGVLSVTVAIIAAWSWFSSNPLRQALGLLLVVIALLSVVVGIVLTNPRLQLALIRIAFILVACLVPAAMYYLFVVTRKGSLFNEFIANMDRLGLLQSQRYRVKETGTWWESEISQSRRLEAYLQKFEATFGPINEDARKVVMSDDPKVASQAAKLMRVNIAGVFFSEAAIPVLVVTLLLALLWVVTLPPVEISIAMQILQLGVAAAKNTPPDSVPPEIFPWSRALTPNLLPATAAFLGAYFFSLQLLFRRYLRRDLRPNVYVGVAIRILLSVAAIWILQGLAPFVAKEPNTGYLIAMGFVLGVFPRVILQMIEAAAKALVPSALLPSVKSDLPISDLDGLTLWHEARFEDEDIENVPNMASADILELMINTRFPAHRLVDWVDQAMLYTCIGAENKKERRDKLRFHGIRTATALTETYRQAKYKDDDAEAFEKILGTVPRSEVRSLIDAVETMPNARLVRVWRGLDPDGFRKPPLGQPPPNAVEPSIP